MALHLAHKGHDFREVRARPDNIENFQVLAHGAFVSGIRMQYSIRELRRSVRRIRHSGEKSTSSMGGDRYPPGNLGKIEVIGNAGFLWYFDHFVWRTGKE